MAYSLIEPVSAEISVLKSRFIGYAFPLKKKEDIQEILSSMRIQYKDARHICFAYRFLGNEGASDDGEPAKTAGMPLLNLLRGKDLDKTLLLVVRYFGGTLLGAGRLMHTYQETGKLVLNKAKLGKFVEGLRLSFIVSYCDYEHLKRFGEKLGISLKESKFNINDVSFFIEKEIKMASRFLEEASSYGYSPFASEKIMFLEENI